MKQALVSASLTFMLALSAVSIAACQSSTDSDATDLADGQVAFWKVKPTASPSPTASPKPSPTSSSTPSPAPSSSKTDALIFDGTGTSASNAQTLIDMVAGHDLSYRVVDSYQLANMTSAELAAFRLIIWPGGNSITMNDALAASTRQKVRNAVVSSGVNFVGFCAGAWMAVGPTPAAGAAPYWGLSIVPGDYLKAYDPNGTTTNPTAAIVKLNLATSSRYVVWWDSPYLWDISGGVLARYPDGKAAMVQTMAGNGFVVLTGPHPEAPQSWRDAEGLSDPDGLDTVTAWSLIEGALNRRPISAL